MSPFAVSCDEVGYAYKPGQWILRGLSAHIPQGRVLAILGPNGRGKTTLLKLLVGALTPVEGRLSLAGDVAFVPQLFETTFSYSALEMVVMGRVRRIGLFSQPGRADLERARAALDRFGLADLAERPFGTLSGGQRQLVIFARAYVAEARIMVLDEPTSALDLRNQALVLQWIHRLAQEEGLTVIFTTHHPHHALWAADEALLLFGGARHMFGTARSVLTGDNLTALYDTPIKRIPFELDGQPMEILTPIFTPRAPFQQAARACRLDGVD